MKINESSGGRSLANITNVSGSGRGMLATVVEATSMLLSQTSGRRLISISIKKLITSRQRILLQEAVAVVLVVARVVRLVSG
jgi:hypothetical protein